MLIAQISDCHIRDHVGTFGKLVDTTETLGRVVDHLVDLDPGPDVVLATGDLTDDGTGGGVAVEVDLRGRFPNSQVEPAGAAQRRKSSNEWSRIRPEALSAAV